MTREEWEELMEYLAQEKIQRARLHRKYLKRFEHHGRHAYLIEEMAEGYIRHSRNPHRQVDLNSERDYIRSVQRTLSESTELSEDIGMLDILEDYESLIREGMQFEDFPLEDVEVLRTLGESNPRSALLAAFYKEKSKTSFYESEERYKDSARSPASSLRRGQEKIRHIADQIDEHLKKGEETEKSTSDSNVRPSRRWFKGLGKIAQGSAITIADACLAAGVLVFPV